VIALGARSFITGFKLAGVEGIEAASSKEALGAVRHLSRSKDVSLILLSDDYTRDLEDELTKIKATQTLPIIYSLPSPGATRVERVEYRELLKKILGF